MQTLINFYCSDSTIGWGVVGLIIAAIYLVTNHVDSYMDIVPGKIKPNIPQWIFLVLICGPFSWAIVVISLIVWGLVKLILWFWNFLGILPSKFEKKPILPKDIEQFINQLPKTKPDAHEGRRVDGLKFVSRMEQGDFWCFIFEKPSK